MMSKFADYFAEAVTAQSHLRPLLENLDLFKAISIIEDKVSIEFQTSILSFRIARDYKEIKHLSYRVGKAEKQCESIEKLKEGFLKEVKKLLVSQKAVTLPPTSLQRIFYVASLLELNPEIIVTLFTSKDIPRRKIILDDEGLMVANYVTNTEKKWVHAFLGFNSLLSTLKIPSISTQNLWDLEKATLQDFVKWSLSFSSETGIYRKDRSGNLSFYPICSKQLENCRVVVEGRGEDDVVNRIISKFKLHSDKLAELLKSDVYFRFSMPFYISGEIHEDRSIIWP